MIRFRFASALRLVSDALLPIPVGYYLLLHNSDLQLIRVRGKRVSVVAQHVGAPSAESISVFLTTLHVQGLFPSLPVTVLMHNCYSYTCIRRAARFSTEEVLHQVTAVTQASAQMRRALLQGRSHQFLVVQGVDKEFLSTLEEVCKANDLPVMCIETLPAFLLQVQTTRFDTDATLMLVAWSKRLVNYVGMNHRGQFFDGAVAKDEAADFSLIEAEVICTYLPEELVRRHIYEVTGPDSRSRMRESWLPARPILSRVQPQLAFANPVTPRLRVITIAHNSLRLFNAVALVALAIALCWMALLTFFNRVPIETVAGYQALYREEQRLQAEFGLLEKLPGEHIGESDEAAALFAAFCQEQIPGVMLSAISVQPSPLHHDGTSAEVSGLGQDDQAVFDFVQLAQENCHPLSVRLVHMRPEIVQHTGLQDTMLAFKLTVTRGAHVAAH